MSTTSLPWEELVHLATRPTPDRMLARGRSDLGHGRNRERDAFTVLRDGPRWRIDQQLDPVRVVGDATRDLVSERGGLRRLPAPQGWSGLPAVSLLRPELEGLHDLSIFTPLGSPEATEWCGRDCWRIDLAYRDKAPFTLRVDASTGVRLSQKSIEGVIWLDELDVDGPAFAQSDAFALLDLSVDVNLQLEVPTPPVLAEIVSRIEAVSPAEVQAAVRHVDYLADSYTLVLRQGGAVVAFFDRRSDEHALAYDALLPGRQERWDWEPWSYSFDALKDDTETRQWARALFEHVVRAEPRPDDPVH